MCPSRKLWTGRIFVKVLLPCMFSVKDNGIHLHLGNISCSLLHLIPLVYHSNHGHNSSTSIHVYIGGIRTLYLRSFRFRPLPIIVCISCVFVFVTEKLLERYPHDSKSTFGCVSKFCDAQATKRTRFITSIGFERAVPCASALRSSNEQTCSICGVKCMFQ